VTARRIFLSPAESRGLLAGRVSLLLRPVRFPEWARGHEHKLLPTGLALMDDGRPKRVMRCPFGVPGDALWGAEAWAHFVDDNALACVIYRADMTALGALYADGGEGEFGRVAGPPVPVEKMLKAVDGDVHWCGAQRMPREASRHALTLTSVRVVRVRDVSEEDARACGAPDWEGDEPCDHRGGLRETWTARYGARYPWETSWCWALRVRAMRAEAGAC